MKRLAMVLSLLVVTAYTVTWQRKKAMRTAIVFALLAIVACNGNLLAPGGPEGAASTRIPTLIFKIGHDGNIGTPAFFIADAHGGELYGEDVPPFEPGTITLTVWGESINADRVSGTLQWDPELLECVSWERGRKMDEFVPFEGLVDWDVRCGDGKLVFSISRSDALEFRSAKGDGPIVFFRMRPVADAGAGVTELIWVRAALHEGIDFRFHDMPGRRHLYVYSGEVTVLP